MREDDQGQHRLERLDALAARRWALTTRAVFAARRGEIDALNVFPVPDGDTGTNLYLTLDAALDAVRGDAGGTGEPATRTSPDLARDADSLARATLLARPRQLRGDPQPARAGAERGRRPGVGAGGGRGRPDPGPRAAAGQRPGAGERHPPGRGHHPVRGHRGRHGGGAGVRRPRRRPVRRRRRRPRRCARGPGRHDRAAARPDPCRRGRRRCRRLRPGPGVPRARHLRCGGTGEQPSPPRRSAREGWAGRPRGARPPAVGAVHGRARRRGR